MASRREAHAGPGTPWCPSAAPTQDSVVFAVRDGRSDRPGVRYLDDTVPVSGDVLALAGPVDPREVFRFGAACRTTACAHFSNGTCSLATRIAALPAVVESIPPCRIRAACRWYAQEGADACFRCPGVVTLQHNPTPEWVVAALGTAPDTMPATTAAQTSHDPRIVSAGE